MTAASIRDGLSARVRREWDTGPAHGSGAVTTTSVARCPPGGSMNGSSAGSVAPSFRTQQPYPAVQHRVAAVAGQRKPQLRLRIRLDLDLLRMQVCHRGKTTERRGATVVQPIPRIQRLCRLCVRRQHRVIGFQYLRHVQPGQHRGDLESVQREALRRKLLDPRLFEKVDTGRRRDPAQSRTNLDMGCRTGCFDQAHRDPVGGVDVSALPPASGLPAAFSAPSCTVPAGSISNSDPHGGKPPAALCSR